MDCIKQDFIKVGRGYLYYRSEQTGRRNFRSKGKFYKYLLLIIHIVSFSSMDHDHLIKFLKPNILLLAVHLRPTYFLIEISEETIPNNSG